MTFFNFFGPWAWASFGGEDGSHLFVGGLSYIFGDHEHEEETQKEK